MFVASKVEETPCYLDKITSVAYQLKHRKNSAAAAQRIQVKEVFLRQKELILVGETLLLATIGFDLNIQHPYKPLIAAVKRLGLPNNVARVAWNFLNDWLRTTLYLQYKPHYIAAGSLYLAAKISNVRLSSDKGPVWWQEFDVLPRQLDESVQHMMDIMGYKRRVAVPDAADKTVPVPTEVKETQQSNSSESCISSLGEGSSPMVDDVLEHKQTLPKQDAHLDSFFSNTKSSSVCGKSGLKRQYSDSHCCSGVVYHGNVKNAPGKTRLDFPRCAATQDVSLPNRLDMSSVDTERTRERLKRRRFETVNNDAPCNPRQHSWGRHQ